MEPQIVIFGGTTEGRILAESLQDSAVAVHICVATRYGGTLIGESENIHIHEGRMDELEMEKFMKEKNISCCVDATHPYAVEVSQNAKAVCEKQKISYIRVSRGQSGAGADGAYYFESVKAAAEYLNGSEGRIFITTGSKELENYTCIEGYEERCIARVLPTVEVLKKCKSLGFEGANVIAMQGPFDKELNLAMLRKTKAAWIVSKISGKEGGFEDKCEAAREAGVRLVLIGRPGEEKSAVSLQEAIRMLTRKYDLKLPRKAFLIGMGPGAGELLTRQAVRTLEESDVIIGARRVLDICPGQIKKPEFAGYKKEEILRFLEEHPEYRRVALLYSGDIGFYSGARNMEGVLKEEGFEIEHISGISSMMYFLNQIGVSYEDVLLESCHGKEENLIGKISTNKKVCVLVGEEDFLQKICGGLREYGLGDVKVTVGECLSYPEEQIFFGKAAEFVNRTINKLSVVLFENTQAEDNYRYIHDEQFIRGKIPMTKEEIRILSIAKMELRRDSVCYDIGAGTGSVCVEMARKCLLGKVFAVEKKPEAAELIRENRRKFAVDNLEVIEGTAPDAIEALPKPDVVFIGGSDGKIVEIIETIRKKNKKARFVINVIALETLIRIMEYCGKDSECADAQVIAVNVARSKKLAGYHLMEAENPIYIIRFGGERYDSKE